MTIREAVEILIIEKKLSKSLSEDCKYFAEYAFLPEEYRHTSVQTREAIDIAVKYLLKFDKIIADYEALVTSFPDFTESSKEYHKKLVSEICQKIDNFNIETTREIILDYYAEKILEEQRKC